MEKVHIFDTTLRDGEQSPGASLDENEKLEIARQLALLKVDIIEAGFPVTSPGDAHAVKRIAEEVTGGPTVCALARSVQKDMDIALESLKPARHPRLHLFLATSEIHRKYKLKKAKDEIIRLAVWAVEYARKRIDEIEFSPEDASRTEPAFLYRVIEAVIKSGACVVNIPDTVGYATPREFGELIRGIRNHVPNIEKARISVHCHNDLGLAVANSLSAVYNGARQVECTVNGIGERAGNASLEEIVMALDTRKDVFKLKTTVDKSQIIRASRLVSSLTGMVVQPNKAIVGRNAFSHESGIHQDGVLKKRSTYEIINPEEIGWGESKIVLGKLSGRHAFSERLKQMGFKLGSREIDEAFQSFKELADKKKEIFDDDLEAIAERQSSNVSKTYELDFLSVVTQTGKPPQAALKLKSKGKGLSASGSGDGPVDACYKTIDRMTRLPVTLLDYNIRSVTLGQDAQGEVTVRIQGGKGGEVASGRGVSTDIIEASVKAYLDAINKLIHKKEKKQYIPGC